MRHYPADSPEAMARIIAHTLMVDGIVDFKDKGRMGRFVSVTPGPCPGSETPAAS